MTCEGIPHSEKIWRKTKVERRNIFFIVVYFPDVMVKKEYRNDIKKVHAGKI